MRKYSEKEKENAMRLVEERHFSCSEAARQMGCNAGSIIRWLDEKYKVGDVPRRRYGRGGREYGDIKEFAKKANMIEEALKNSESKCATKDDAIEVVFPKGIVLRVPYSVVEAFGQFVANLSVNNVSVCYRGQVALD